MAWRRQRQSWVAVDRGACSFRAAQLVLGPDGPRVCHWINVENPPKAGEREAATANNNDAGAASAVATAMEQFNTRRVGLVMGSPDVDYCLLTVPQAVLSQGPKELAQAIRWEVGRQLAWPVEEAELAAWPLPMAMSGGSNAMAVAARRSGIVSSVETLRTQRVECECVEPAALAMVRACRVTAQFEKGEIWGVLDLGHTADRLYMAIDSTVVYARNVRGSGQAWTQAIANELRIDCGVAEQYKRKYGIGADARGCRVFMGAMEPLSDAALPGVLLAVLKTDLADLVADIERAFRFVMEQYPRRQPGLLVLVGGGSRMAGLPEWLAKELGVQVRQASVEGVLKTEPSHPLSRSANYSVMAGCIGLALAETDS
jgi:type IV pilus assembly protein PilM